MPSHILTITLNPTVDYCTTAPGIQPGVKLRCTEPQIDPGGGGINVARAVRLLGGQARRHRRLDRCELVAAARIGRRPDRRLSGAW